MDETKELLFAIIKNQEETRAEIKFIRDDLTRLETKVNRIQNDVNTLKEEVAGLKEDVTVLKADVAGLKEDVTVLKADVAGLKEELSSFKDETAANFKAMREETKRLITTEIQSLKVEMNLKFQDFKAELRQSRRIERGLDAELNDLTERMERLEEQRANG